MGVQLDKVLSGWPERAHLQTPPIGQHNKRLVPTIALSEALKVLSRSMPNGSCQTAT